MSDKDYLGKAMAYLVTGDGTDSKSRVVKRFYATIMAGMRRKAVEGLGTLGVQVTRHGIELLYDPEVVATLSIEKLAVVLEHEALHILLGHIPRTLDLFAELPSNISTERFNLIQRIFQVCADLSVNSLLLKDAGWIKTAEEFPGLTPEGVEKIYAKYGDVDTIPAQRSMEEYVNLFMTARMFERFQSRELMQEIAALSSLHDLWAEACEAEGSGGEGDEGDGQSQPGQGREGEGQDAQNGSGNSKTAKKAGEDIVKSALGRSPTELKATAEMLRRKVAGIVKQAIKHMGEKAWGNMPGYLQSLVQNLTVDRQVPWQQILDRIIRQSMQGDLSREFHERDNGLSVVSRQTGILPNFGLVTDPTYRLIVFFDTSGSVSDAELSHLRAILHGLMEINDTMYVRVIQGDTEIHFDEEFRGKDTLPDKMLGRGGTNFDAYFEYMQKYTRDPWKKPDLIIVATDGGCSPVSHEYRTDVPVIWLLTVGPESYEHKTILDSKFGSIVNIR